MTAALQAINPTNTGGCHNSQDLQIVFDRNINSTIATSYGQYCPFYKWKISWFDIPPGQVLGNAQNTGQFSSISGTPQLSCTSTTCTYTISAGSTSQGWDNVGWTYQGVTLAWRCAPTWASGTWHYHYTSPPPWGGFSGWINLTVGC